MLTTLQRFNLALVIYLAVFIGTVLFIKPFSFTSFIGPIAGITTALIIFFGTNILLLTVTLVIAFSVFLSWYFNLTISLAMVIITMLAIVMQSYWAKQITLAEVRHVNWLQSRQVLLIFLFKIGPLTAIVSASSILVIAMLDNQSLAGDLLYTFISSWSGSVLFSIFFTPLLLLTQKRQQLKPSKRFFIIFASSLAFIAIGLLFKISQNVQLYHREDMFKQVKSDVAQTIKQEVALVADELNSLSAFIKASEYISSSEFTLFVEQIRHKNSAIRALEWALIVNHKHRDEYEKQALPIIERNNTVTMQRAKDRALYAPVHYVYPILGNYITLGFDVLTNSADVISMDKVIASNNIITSAPINLIQGDYSNPGILFISSVHDKNKQIENSVTNNNKQSLLGFVIAVAQFEDLFHQIDKFTDNGTDLFIEDVTDFEPYILFGKQLINPNLHTEQIDLTIYSRHWRISFVEQQPWQMQQKSWQTWGMLLGATFGGIIFQLLILMMAAYSSELSMQVIRKTQELILAKDKSEQENIAKTNFLNMLNKELQTPLQAIHSFIEQLRKTQQKQQPNIINNIDLAQKNMSQLLDMVIDLSKIESGELLAKSEPFDFHGFLARIDEILKVKNIAKNRSITLLIDSSVPHFITSDELRIQQFLIVLCENIHQLYAMNNIRLTVKVHHQVNTATLLFVFTEQDDEKREVKAPFVDYLSKDISLYNTQMSMVKEVCQLMKGDVSLGMTKSGERILTAAIKIIQTTSEQQQNYQARFFGDENDT